MVWLGATLTIERFSHTMWCLYLLVDEETYKGETLMMIQTSSCPHPRIIVDFTLYKKEMAKYSIDLWYTNDTFEDMIVQKRVRVNLNWT